MPAFRVFSWGLLQLERLESMGRWNNWALHLQRSIVVCNDLHWQVAGLKNALVLSCCMREWHIRALRQMRQHPGEERKPELQEACLLASRAAKRLKPKLEAGAQAKHTSDP